MNSKLRVRVISPWPVQIQTEDAWFSSELNAEKADALLCYWRPSPELLSFQRRKAWYCCEPEWNFRRLENGSWPTVKARLRPNEFLWHQHPEPKYRVPHMTHFQELQMSGNQDRINRAVAIVSNCGGQPWQRHADHHYRNRFVTSRHVDLFGRPSWRRYRAHWYSLPQAPANYRGGLPGDWPDEAKRELMARYKVAVCLENVVEPCYFTEKFVEAVCAGCVPVYRAHPTVAETFLNGAVWVDPTAYRGDVEAVLEAAFRLNAGEVSRQNERWLATSQDLRATSNLETFRKIGRILANE